MSAGSSVPQVPAEPSAGTNLPTVQQPPREPLPAIPPFSYAQAAKGRPSAASPNATTSTSSTLSTSEKDLKRTVSSDRGPTAADASRDAKKRTASEGGMSESRKPIEKTDVSSNPPVDGPKEPITEDPGKADDQGVQKSGSSPSSPEYGTTSTSTLPKEEDISSNGNGSSESTWDKQSQSSQNGMNSDKLESDQQTEPVAAPAWDEEASATPSFKEAAPPALNVWQQRIEIQNAAKAKTKQVPTQQPKSPTGSTGHAGVNGLGRGSDIAGESRKQEVRKKGKTVTEEKPGADGGKVTTKEGKRRSSDDGAKAARRRNDATMQNEDPALMATTAAVAPPPPPGDSSSWPTPDNAAGEEKKRPQPQQKHNDGEKEKDTPKPSGKKGWTPIPFVPTPVFNTPLPQARRGGRGPSGGNRDNPPRGRNNAPSANGSEKTGNANTSANTVQSTTNDRSAKPKRASSAGPISGKEQRKASENFVTERRKDIFNEDGPPGQTKKPASNDSKRQVAVPVPATPQIVRSPGRATESERNPLPKPMGDNYHSTENESQNFGFDAHSQSRDHGPERRSEGSVRPGDLAKDFQGSFSGKDRGEERPSRGRGGRGGRGGANQPAYNGHLANGNAYSNGQAYQYQPSYAPQQRSFSNHERIPSQSQGNFFGPSSPHRSYRASSRSQFNSGYMSTSGRFSNGPSSGPSHLPSIHTDLANMSAYQPGAQGIMSAIPYNPYEEHVTLFDMVTMQMEYYFSLDNLCKDMFLRKHMDSQGWVFLSVLAGFNRIVALTTDLEMIRYVCFNSQKIELKPGQVWQDGRDRLRARDTWKSFVLNKDQRDPTAQHDGPALASGAPRDDSMPRNDDQHAVSPRTNASNGPLDFPYQSLNAIAPSAAQHAPSNAKVNGNHTDFSQPPLSAAVSEFTPSVHSHPSRRFALPDTRANETKLFTDEDVQHLQILVRQPINSAHPPFHSASSRTFSNGSIDGRNLNDELSELAERQSRPVNGEVFESDRAKRSRSPFVVGSPSRRPDLERSPPVFWMKNKENSSALESCPNELSLEPYLAFRCDALREREQAPSGKLLSNMQNLYHFWSHFLVRNFNNPMYEEFRTLAIDDASTRASPMGMQSLMQYYDEALLGHRTILEDNIARHYVGIVRNEDKSQDRPAFKKLRGAWRNGAFNHKNRSKILKVIDSELKDNELKEELDR